MPKKSLQNSKTSFITLPHCKEDEFLSSSDGNTDESLIQRHMQEEKYELLKDHARCLSRLYSISEKEGEATLNDLGRKRSNKLISISSLISNDPSPRRKYSLKILLEEFGSPDLKKNMRDIVQQARRSFSYIDQKDLRKDLSLCLKSDNGEKIVDKYECTSINERCISQAVLPSSLKKPVVLREI